MHTRIGSRPLLRRESELWPFIGRSADRNPARLERFFLERGKSCDVSCSELLSFRQTGLPVTLFSSRQPVPPQNTKVILATFDQNWPAVMFEPNSEFCLPSVFHSSQHHVAVEQVTLRPTLFGSGPALSPPRQRLHVLLQDHLGNHSNEVGPCCRELESGARESCHHPLSPASTELRGQPIALARL